MLRALQAQLAVIVFSFLCAVTAPNPQDQSESESTDPFVVVLGIAQDGGFPQAGCRRECCAASRGRPESRRLVSSLAIIDPAANRRWIIDCTPDFPEQLHRLYDALPVDEFSQSTGLLLTHAHVGAYPGLI